jgi:hypothetical protein
MARIKITMAPCNSTKGENVVEASAHGDVADSDSAHGRYMGSSMRAMQARRELRVLVQLLMRALGPTILGFDHYR